MKLILFFLVLLIGWGLWNQYVREGFIDAQVFHVRGPSGNEYIFSKNQLSSVCKKYGARGATYAELEAAHADDSADWCSTGWVSDKSTAYYPIQTNRLGCGDNTQLTEYTPGNAGVNCYGKKPLSSQFSGETVMPFQYKADGLHIWNDPNPTNYTPSKVPDRHFETYEKRDGVLLSTPATCSQTSFTTLEAALRACDDCKAECSGVTDFYGMFELRKGVTSSAGNSSYIKRPPPNYNYFIKPT
jgi:hypothetical protein